MCTCISETDEQGRCLDCGEYQVVESSAVERFVRRLATSTARDIFAMGDEPDSVCQRIEFKGGTWPEQEIPQGGLEESDLAKHLKESMMKHLLSA